MVFGRALYLLSPFAIIDFFKRADKKESANIISNAFLTGSISGYIYYSLTFIQQKGIDNILDISQIKKSKVYL